MKTHCETFEVFGPKIILISQIINFWKMAGTKLLYQEGFCNTDTHGYGLRFSSLTIFIIIFHKENWQTFLVEAQQIPKDIFTKPSANLLIICCPL